MATHSTSTWPELRGDSRRLDGPEPAGADAPLSAPAMAVTITNIEPRTFRPAQRLRAWLGARGIARVTLAVVPAADLHPVGTRAPMLIAWLRGQAARGDAIAQQGCHPGGRREFSRLGSEECRGRLEAGLAMLRDVELDPFGFIAPAYAYTPVLRRELINRYAWFAERRTVRGRGSTLAAPALTVGAGAAPQLAMSWARLRRWRNPDTRLVRIDIAAGRELAMPTRRALEALLAHEPREVVTYDDIFGLGA